VQEMILPPRAGEDLGIGAERQLGWEARGYLFNILQGPILASYPLSHEAAPVSDRDSRRIRCGRGTGGPNLPIRQDSVWQGALCCAAGQSRL
jgi:hypothetical protein